MRRYGFYLWTVLASFAPGLVVSCGPAGNQARAELTLDRPAVDVGSPTWEQGTFHGRSGWWVARRDVLGRLVVFESDQPSGKNEPCYLHRRASGAFPLSEPTGPGMLVPSSSRGWSVGATPNYGINLTGLAMGAREGGQVLSNDPAVAGRVMADMAAHPDHPDHPLEGPCPGPGPCPIRPDRPSRPDDDDDEDPPDGTNPGGIEAIRPYLMPAALFAGLFAALVTLRRRGQI